MTVTRRINLDAPTQVSNPFQLFDTVFGSGAYNQLPNHWAEQAKITGNYPPYNLTKNADSTQFDLTLAVAGFAPSDLDVSVRDNQLIISGGIDRNLDKDISFERKNDPDNDIIFVHRGIAERAFKKTFDLGEYVEVQDVTHKHGMLHVHLALMLPESKKPKKFTIALE